MPGLFSTGPVVCAGTPAFQLNEVTSPSFSAGTEIYTKRSAGQPDPSFNGLVAIKPKYTFNTEEIGKLLGSVPAFGCFLFGTEPGANVATVTYIHTAFQQGCTRKTGSTHFPIQFNNGMIFVESIRAAQDQIASASVMLSPYMYGTSVPVEFPSNVALPAASSLLVEQQYTMGPVRINGTLYNSDAQSWEYTAGAEIYQRGGGGSIFPTKTGIRQREPSFMVSMDDIELARSITISGTPQSASATEFYLRKKTKHAGNVPDATAEHIKLALSASQGMIMVEDISGDDFSQIKLKIAPVTGVAAAVVATVGVAIPAS